MTTRMDRRRFIAGIGAMGAATLIGGCTPPANWVRAAAPAQPMPAYYPADYSRLIEASRTERRVVVYSNMDTFNWQPIVGGFRKHYPWVEDIVTTNLSSPQVFQRYNAERAAGQPQASFMVSGAPRNWLNFANSGQALDYVSPELPKLPEYARGRGGVYAFSTDAMIMIYNKLLLTDHERPRSIHELIRLVSSDPARFKNRLTTNSASSSFGQPIQYAYFQSKQRNWHDFDALLPCTRPEEQNGSMLDKVSSGEYLVGYFVSGPVVLPQLAQLDKVVGWNLISDGTPLFLRGMAIPANAPHPNTATLMLDYILSAEGQENVAGGGFTAYRSGVVAADGLPTYDSILAEIGKDNVVMIGYDQDSQAEQDEFTRGWEARLD